MENDFHSVKAGKVTEGFQSTCTCGWLGPIRNRTSDNRAWRNARDDGTQHFKEVERRRADSASPAQESK